MKFLLYKSQVLKKLLGTLRRANYVVLFAIESVIKFIQSLDTQSITKQFIGIQAYVLKVNLFTYISSIY